MPRDETSVRLIADQGLVEQLGYQIVEEKEQLCPEIQCCAVDSQDHRSRKITNQYWRCFRPRLSELRPKIQMSFMLMMAHGTVTLISPMW
jgi:hypothetical protein